MTVYEPRPVLRASVRWRWAEHPEHGTICETWDDAQRWRPKRAWVGDVWAGLEAGEGYEELLARLTTRHGAEQNPVQLDRLLRGHLLDLWRRGTVDLGFPDEHLGPYRIIDELGRGGVGIAWRADGPQGRVVVKRAWDYHIPLVAADEQIQHEARVLAALEHPRIPCLRETYGHNGLVHLVRDEVEGSPPKGPLGDALASFAKEVLDILEHMHGRGWLLLDVRPDNFLIGPEGASLVDAGLARPRDGAALARPIGTPGYAAPETMARREVSVQTDLFAFGRTLAHLATGRLPRHAWRVADVRRAVAGHSLADAITALCHDDPHKRPRDVAAARGLIAQAL